jgi:hypothetical protein
LGVLGAIILLVAYPGASVSLAVNAFWYVLLLALALFGGLAWGRPRAAVVGGELVLALIAVQGLWSVAVPSARPPAGRLGPVYGVSWRLTFDSPEQALMKTVPLPNGWDGQEVYLRVDLGTDYKGGAGFAVAVNGQDLGDLNARTAAPGYVTPGIPSWAMRVPPSVLERSSLVRVVLRPSGVDPKLSIPGHADTRGEALGAENSYFFDGDGWRNDRLAGPAGGRATGTYRIYLDAFPPKR